MTHGLPIQLPPDTLYFTPNTPESICELQHAPVQKLPFETIQAIFRELYGMLDLRDAPHDLKRKRFLSISGVCRNWRQIMLRTHEFWTDLDVEAPRATQTYLERSGTAPLHVIYTSPTFFTSPKRNVQYCKDTDEDDHPTPISFATLITPHITQVTSFHAVCADKYIVTDALRILDRNLFTSLKSLRIVLQSKAMSVVDLRGLGVISPFIWPGPAPAVGTGSVAVLRPGSRIIPLQHLSLTRVMFPFDYPVFGPKLVEFSLSAMSNFSPNLQSLLDLIKRCPLLKTLELDSAGPVSSGVPPTEIVHAPSLKRLVLRRVEGPMASSFFHHLYTSAHVDVELKLHGDVSWPPSPAPCPLFPTDHPIRQRPTGPNVSLVSSLRSFHFTNGVDSIEVPFSQGFAHTAIAFNNFTGGISCDSCQTLTVHLLDRNPLHGQMDNWTFLLIAFPNITHLKVLVDGSPTSSMESLEPLTSALAHSPHTVQKLEVGNIVYDYEDMGRVSSFLYILKKQKRPLQELTLLFELKNWESKEKCEEEMLDYLEPFVINVAVKCTYQRTVDTASVYRPSHVPGTGSESSE